MKTARVIALLYLQSISACTAAATSLTNNSSDSQATGPMLIGVRAIRMTSDQSMQGPFEPGDRLSSGDYFSYFVRTDKPAHIYVVQFFANGEQKVLFPGEASERIPAATEARIPTDANEWFRLDNAQGTEHIYVIASRLPLEQADANLARIVRDIRTSPRSVPLPSPSNSPTPITASPLPSATPDRPKASSSAAASTARPQLGPYDLLHRKGANRVRVTIRGTAVFQGRSGEDGVGVIHFPFEHQ